MYQPQHTYSNHYTQSPSMDPCAICLCPLDLLCDNDVIHLGCSHSFHSHCLAQCTSYVCPLCRCEMTSAEVKEVCLPHKVLPLFDEVFQLPVSQQPFIYDIVQTTVDNMLDGCVDEGEVFGSCVASYWSCAKKLKDATRRDTIVGNGSLILFDWICVMNKAIGHYSTYGTYDGLKIACSGNVLRCLSSNPFGIRYGRWDDVWALPPSRPNSVNSGVVDGTFPLRSVGTEPSAPLLVEQLQ